MNNLSDIRVGDTVLVFSPEYVAGMVGVVRTQEVINGKEHSERWLIELSSDMVVSLTAKEFEIINQRHE